MATRLSITDFTDLELKDSLGIDKLDHVTNGENDYLLLADQYYLDLLRERGIDSTDTGLADPPIFKVKEVMICWTAMRICRDLTEDSRAPFSDTEVQQDKFQIKYRFYKACWNDQLAELDDNAFFDTAKGTESSIIGTFGRR